MRLKALTRLGLRLALCCSPMAWMAHALTPDLVFEVAESAGVPRTNEVLASGLPLPRELGVRFAGQLQVTTLDGRSVPARFHELARWQAGRTDTNAPLQWVLMEMPVSVPASHSRHFRLTASASPATPPPLPTRLQVSQNGRQITVDTGKARFSLGGNPNLLFDEIRLPNGTLVASGQPLSAIANDQATFHSTLRRLRIERTSDLAAVVVVDGEYDLPPVGTGGMSGSRRYEFFAGSGTVLVRQEVAWEGNLAPVGVLGEAGVPNGVKVRRVRDSLGLHLDSPRQTLLWGAIDSSPTIGRFAASPGVALTQQLRDRHTDALKFDLQLGTTKLTGPAATAGLLALSDSTKTIAAALDHMHHYEPQALSWLDNDEMAVDVAADRVWLGARQGLFARFGIHASAGQVQTEALRSEVWAKLNHPLRAWPSPAWFAASQAVEEFPVGPLPAEWQSYQTLLPAVLSRTTNLIHQFGLSGLQTYGLFTRYWGNPAEGFDELTNSAADPTPNETWDDIYWGANWTDYHNTAAAPVYWAMRSGEVSWLDEIATPAALRMLHTQIIHGAPPDPYFYIGQSPCGYGGYRSDFNSSHGYFDNLFLYYWLSGDYSVVETLQRGASSMRSYYCPGRPETVIDPLQPGPNEYAYSIGRVASQWLKVFHFVGLAGDDPTYLEDFRGHLARAVTQHYVELNGDGRRYGFWCPQPVSAPGTNTTDQLWMNALYDLNNLHRWMIDSQDSPLGVPPVRPSEVLSATARTLTYLAPNVAPEANGTAGGQWPNAILFVWEGQRVGGTLRSVTNYVIPAADPYLWDTGKAVLAATVGRAADFTGDPVMRGLAAELAHLALRASWNQGTPIPLGKEQGLYLSRLPQALAHLNPSHAPQLQLVCEEGRVFVLVPNLAQSWTLESTPTLTTPKWQALTDAVQPHGVVLNLPVSGCTYYRLRSP